MPAESDPTLVGRSQVANAIRHAKKTGDPSRILPARQFLNAANLTRALDRALAAEGGLADADRVALANRLLSADGAR